jgi:hypothetical protein
LFDLFVSHHRSRSPDFNPETWKCPNPKLA